jgi:hypothetical protein
LTPSTSGISRIALLRVRNLSSAVLQQEIRILQILADFNSETRKRSITISVYDLYKRSDWNMLRVWPPLCQCHSDVLHERVQDAFGNMMKDGVTPFLLVLLWLELLVFSDC